MSNTQCECEWTNKMDLLLYNFDAVASWDICSLTLSLFSFSSQNSLFSLPAQVLCSFFCSCSCIPHASFFFHFYFAGDFCSRSCVFAIHFSEKFSTYSFSHQQDIHTYRVRDVSNMFSIFQNISIQFLITYAKKVSKVSWYFYSLVGFVVVVILDTLIKKKNRSYPTVCHCQPNELWWIFFHISLSRAFIIFNEHF